MAAVYQLRCSTSAKIYLSGILSDKSPQTFFYHSNAALCGHKPKLTSTPLFCFLFEAGETKRIFIKLGRTCDDSKVGIVICIDPKINEFSFIGFIKMLFGLILFDGFSLLCNYSFAYYIEIKMA
jgi:hypothetical protein